MALSQSQIAKLWVSQGGDAKYADMMARIAQRESGGRPEINNRGTNKNGTVDWGLFQVNDVWRKDPVIGKMFQSGAILTPQGGTKAAIRILKIQGPKAWATYNAATDAKYIGQNALAQSAGAASSAPSTAQTIARTVGGVDNSPARAAAVSQFLGSKSADPLSFAMQIRGLQDTPGQKTTTTTAVARAASTGQPPASAAGTGSYPTGRRGKIIGTPYQGTHTLGNWQSDNAVDIAVPVGTPMVALQNGVVVKVVKHPQGSGRFAGDQITVRGANGNEYFYAHGSASVQAGQKVSKGQSLGTTGSANGVAHLHLGQMKGDPRQHVQ